MENSTDFDTCVYINFYDRFCMWEVAQLAVAHISYGNSVRPSVCHDSVLIQAQVR